MKCLFLLKYREDSYGSYQGSFENMTPLDKACMSSGLLNSATFIHDNLRGLGIEVCLQHAIDNNQIDKIVTETKPDIVIIEAYWVVPEKFTILAKLHPRIKWIIRNHSAMPFLSAEGQILDWSLRYMDYKHVYVSCNDPRTNEEMRDLVKSYKPGWSHDEVAKRVIYLPNFYPTAGALPVKKWDSSKTTLDVACFGSVRPLKNQLIQATAAITAAKELGKTLRFHINGDRVEGGHASNSILLNLRKLFDKMPHFLIEHGWLPHNEFLSVLRTMDISLQVSYSETFNIVSADAVVCGIPIVVSNDIKWVNKSFTADPNNSHDIVKIIKRSLHASLWPQWLRMNVNIDSLNKYNRSSTLEWMRLFSDEETFSDHQHDAPHKLPPQVVIRPQVAAQPQVVVPQVAKPQVIVQPQIAVNYPQNIEVPKIGNPQYNDIIYNHIKYGKVDNLP